MTEFLTPPQPIAPKGHEWQRPLGEDNPFAYKLFADCDTFGDWEDMVEDPSKYIVTAKA